MSQEDEKRNQDKPNNEEVVLIKGRRPGRPKPKPPSGENRPWESPAEPTTPADREGNNKPVERRPND